MRLDRTHSIEIAFLAVATIYSLTLPLKNHLTLFDSVPLVGLYVAYVWRISRTPAEEPHLVGPARLLGALPTAKRRAAVAAMLAYAALAILVCAEPFADALVSTGEELGISTFLLVQWLAPLASEAPELLIACLFAWRLNTNGGLGTLVSSKVNQWTLLVGTLPIVFVLAGGATSGLPLDRLQRGGAVPHRGAVRVRGRHPRQPQHQRARGVGPVHPVRGPVRARRRAARGPAPLGAPRRRDRLPPARGRHHRQRTGGGSARSRATGSAPRPTSSPRATPAPRADTAVGSVTGQT